MDFFDWFDDDCDDIENEDIMDEPFDDDSEFDDEPYETETQDDEFTAKDAFYTGTFAGMAYEEGRRKRRSRK